MLILLRGAWGCSWSTKAQWWSRLAPRRCWDLSPHRLQLIHSQRTAALNQAAGGETGEQHSGGNFHVWPPCRPSRLITPNKFHFSTHSLSTGSAWKHPTLWYLGSFTSWLPSLVPRASRGKHLFHPSRSVEVLFVTSCNKLWNQLPVKMEAEHWQRCLLSLFGCRRWQFLYVSIANPTGTWGARKLWRCRVPLSSSVVGLGAAAAAPSNSCRQTSTLQQLTGQTQMFQWKSNHVELICSADCTWAHLTPCDHLHWSILWRIGSSIKGDPAPHPLRSTSSFVSLKPRLSFRFSAENPRLTR